MKNNKVTYYILIVLLLILIGVSSFFLIYFYNLRGQDLSIEEISISESNKMSYNVKLKDNKYYKSNIEGDTFVISLIDNINTYFNYSVAFSSSITGEYSYYIVGNAVYEYNGEKVKNEIYKSDISKYEITGNVINLSNSFDINLDEIIGDYNGFKNDYGINTTGYIEYVVYINYSVFSEQISKSMMNSKEFFIKIPCEDITHITITEDEVVNRKDFSELNYDDNKLYLIVSLEFMGAIIIFILLIVLIIKRLGKRETVYDYELRLLLKKYDEMIVSIKDLPDLTNYEIFFVDTFEELVDAANNLVLPINFVEVIDKKESTFIVLHEAIAYVYKLSSKSIS